MAQGGRSGLTCGHLSKGGLLHNTAASGPLHLLFPLSRMFFP